MLWSHIDKVVYLPMSQIFFVRKFKVEGCKDCVKYWLEKWRDKTIDITKQNTKYVLYNDTLNIWTRLQS